MNPEPKSVEGPVIYSQRDGRGATDPSKAFFLLNRHRLGPIQRAVMTDYTFRNDPLSLFDANKRAIALSGCSSGYDGEGPHGTLFVLRLSGFFEVRQGPGEYGREGTNLEKVVFTQRSFLLRKG